MRFAFSTCLLLLVAMSLGAAPPRRPVEVDSLLAQLESEDPQRQGEAANRLARLILDKQIAKDDPAVLEGLKGLLLEGHGDASQNARWALCWMGMPALDASLEALRSNNPTAKGYGAQLLGDLGRQFPDQLDRFDTAIVELGKYVRDDDKFVRLCAIQALGNMGPKAVPSLIEALANPLGSGDRSGWNAAEGLAQMGKVAVPALIEALRSENPVVRRNATYVFYRMRRGQGKDAVPALIEATHDKVADVRRGAASALGMVGPDAKGAGPRLIEMMEQGEGDFAHSLGQVTIGVELVDRVLMLTTKLEERGQSGLPTALASAGEAAVPKLATALSSDSFAVRRVAAVALGHLGPKSEPAIPALISMLSEPKLYYHAAWALGEIGPGAKDAAPALVASLKQDRWATPHKVDALVHHSPAARALGRIGGAAVPELLKGLRSDNELAQAGCVQALGVAGKGAEEDVIPAVLQLHERAGHRTVKGLARQTLLKLHAVQFIKQLTRLTPDDLASMQINETGLARLRGLTNLRVLNLRYGKVNDAELEHIKGLRNLENLSLDYTPVSDPGMERLEGLVNLKYLDLRRTQIGDAGLGHLKALTKLEYLDIAGTQATDAGLAHLKGLANLRELNLRYLPVTDAGLAHLKGLTNLETLTLSDTKITDAGLAHLKGLNRLKGLWVYRTQVTEDGVKELKQALPSCTILYTRRR